MRVLILSVTAGQGHNTCAKALLHALEKQNVKGKVVDTIKLMSEFTGTAVDRSYLNMGKYMPGVWGKIYRSAVKISRNVTEHNKSGLIPMIPKSFRYLIDDYIPDAIVCTHFFASLLLTRLRREGNLNIPIIGINTDFTLHPFWEGVDQDYLILACDTMDYMVEKRGIPKNIVRVMGIPVHEKFTQEIAPSHMRRQIGLPEKFTVLLMGGSMGFGNFLDKIDELDSLKLDFQIILICGSNEHLYDEVEKRKNAGRYQKEVFSQGYIDYVHDLMYASDIICTKPGGLSTSETISVGRPLIMLDPIPGLEEINATMLVNNAVGIQSNQNYTLAEAVYNLFAHPERMQEIVEAQKRMSPRHASKNLADFTIECIEKNREKKLHLYNDSVE